MFKLLFLLLLIGCGGDGDQGDIGQSRVWYDGSGVPVNAIGGDGDFYVDNETGDYFKKIENVWIKQGNLRGPKGEVGSKGDTGAKGDSVKGDSGAKGDTGSNGTNNDLNYEIVCEDTLPGNAVYKFYYVVSYFDNGDVFASAQIYDDEDEYGGGSRFYHSSHADYSTAKIKMYFDKTQNDNWGYYTVGAKRDTLEYVVKYVDATDGNENYTVSNKCTKTAF